MPISERIDSGFYYLPNRGGGGNRSYFSDLELNELDIRVFQLAVRANWKKVLERIMSPQQEEAIASMNERRVAVELGKISPDKSVIKFGPDTLPEYIVRALRIMRHADWLVHRMGVEYAPYPASDYTLAVDLRDDLQWLHQRFVEDINIDPLILYRQSVAVLKGQYS